MGADRTVAVDDLRVVFFGTYDSHRPRFLVLNQGLRLNGIDVIECHLPVWGSLEDRSQIQSAAGYVGPLARWTIAAWRLALAYRRLPEHDAVIVPYLGQADVLVARILTQRQNTPLIFDPYVSLYQTVVRDRALAGSGGPVGILAKWLDKRALGVADHVLLDTASHGLLYANELGFNQSKGYVIPVGAEQGVFPWQPLSHRPSVDTVLFYGSMIPLHGITTIIEAASLFRNTRSIRFILVGTGQEYHKARGLSRELGADDVIEWIDAVPYAELAKLIADATICLGIFGTSDKAGAVVPNKVYQCLSVGRPVISGDTAAMREWFTHGKNCLLVPPGDSAALASAIRHLQGNAPLQFSLALAGHELFIEKFSSARIGQLLSELLTRIA